MKHIGLYLIGLLFCDCAWPLGSDLTLQQLNHTRWTVAQGAPSEVHAFAQTTDGTLWVGGATGLFRFDGIRFVRYPQPAEEPLQSTNISALAASPDGGLWIGFRLGGAAFLRYGHLTRYGEQDGLPHGTVDGFAWDHDGTCWVVALRGLARLHGARWERVASESIPEQLLARPLVDLAGTLWVGTDGRVLARTAHDDQFREMARHETRGHVYLAMSPDGNVWAAWEGGSDGPTRMDSPTDPRPNGNRVLSVKGDPPFMFDREGNLWLGSDAIRRVPLRELLSHPTAPQIETFTDGSIGYVDAYFEDREGNIWVGTEIGLDRFSHSNIVRVPLPPCAVRYALAAGDAGALWAACYNMPSAAGFVLEIRNGIVVHREDTPNFNSAYRDPHGTVWFGGEPGLGHIESGRLVMTPFPKEAPEGVQAMARDRTGAFWVTIARQSLFRLSGGRWIEFGGLDAMLRKWHSPIVETTDTKGAVWLGYPYNRIARINGDEVQLFDASHGLNVGNVTAIHASGQHIWIGGELGLARFDGARFVPILGAADNAFTGISGIIETPGGELWLNGFAGITHVSRSEVERVIRDPTHRAQVENFDYLDGVPGTALQIRPTPSAIATTDGLLWFLTTGGVVSIDPARIVCNPLPPPVTVWTISSEGVPYPALGADLQLPIHTTKLRIDYTAGSLTLPERVDFRYKLEGSDLDWQDAGNRREAFYTNLAPGRYTFRVAASNSDGVWNASGASVSFTILPAFYQTTWFYALCALLCLAALYALYKAHVRQVAAQVQGRLEVRLAERERIARELHDTLLQGVQGLILRFQAVVERMSRRDPARALMEQVLGRADQILAEGRDRVKDLRSKAGDEVDLPPALAAEGEQLALAHPAQFRTSVAGARRDLHPIVREEVLFIAREALGNAFRHAGAQHIEAEMSYGNAVLQVRIRDDGRGIGAGVLDAGGRAGHFGLLGMRERAEKIRAQLKICSKAGAGTEIDLQVPAEVAYRRSQTMSRVTWWTKRRLFRLSTEQH